MKSRTVNDRYEVIVPDHISDWDAPSEWERARFLSMEKHLKQGNVLYDIGTEQGWQSAIYAQFVGGGNMVLVEPSPEYWPNIKATWEANDLAVPLATYQGLVGQDANYMRGALGLKEWPDAAEGEITRVQSYRYTHNDNKLTAQNRIDNFPVMEIPPPDAITIDVEGAEYQVLKGAEETLTQYKPKVWCSIHPDLMEKDYNDKEQDLYDYMEKLGYQHENLGWDGHESHSYFRHP